MGAPLVWTTKVLLLVVDDGRGPRSDLTFSHLILTMSRTNSRSAPVCCCSKGRTCRDWPYILDAVCGVCRASCPSSFGRILVNCISRKAGEARSSSNEGAW